jgi:uncharacterized protein YbjT (DUF2867 family)
LTRAVRIAVLGASGLIGHALALDLIRRGFAVTALARRFTAAQRLALGENAVMTPFGGGLARWFEDCDIIVNCVGILQDGPGGTADAVHRVFAGWLATFCAAAPSRLLVHISMPGDAAADRTAFSRSKRAADSAITASGAPYAILRPGFVLASNAYGGSALLRALAMLPLRLPASYDAAPFAAMEEIATTVAWLAQGWRESAAAPQTIWDLTEENPATMGHMVAALRGHLGGPQPWAALPAWLMQLGAWAGDAVSWLGWKPPVRSTALREIRRGVMGDPRPWIAATGIHPRSHEAVLAAMPCTVQERWFARLYLLKSLALAVLVLFWCASGLIALGGAFSQARTILLSHGFSFTAATVTTIVSSLMDIAIGLSIAVSRTSRFGLAVGIPVSLGYMAGAAFIAPDLWLEPLGALVKTFPAIVLMLVALAIRDDR